MSKLTDFPVYSAKTKKRAKYGIVAGAIIVVLVMSMMLSRTINLESPMDALPGKISIVLSAQVYRDGLLVEERINDDDLLTKWFVRSLRALLYWPNAQEFTIELWDFDENHLDFTFWNTTAGETIADTKDDNVVSIGWYGEDTDTPERYDYNMNWNEIGSANMSSYNQDADSFTLTFIWTSDGSYDWSEAGLTVKWFSSEAGYATDVMMAHDTFTPMAVVAEDSLVLNYGFTFATGYTWNMINFLRSIFSGASHGELANLKMYDQTGNVKETRLYTDVQDEEYWRGSIASSFHGSILAVSDSSSGIPSRSAYLLYGSSLQTPATVTCDDDGPSYYVEAQAIFMPNDAFTVRASGLYYYIVDWNGAYNYYCLLFALTHGAVYVPAGTPVRSTFTLDL